MGSEESGLRGPALSCPQRELQESLLCSGIKWSGGSLQNIKFQAPNLRVSGVRCQGRKRKTLKPEH
jgi:hypothetical protein